MPVRRELASAVLGSDWAIYVIGGYEWLETGANRLSTTHRYDIGANTWTTVTALPTSRIWGEAVSVGNNLIQMGGQDAGGANVSSVYATTLGAGAWQTGTAIPKALTSFTANLASDGYIYIVGGGLYGASTYEASVYRADTVCAATPTPTPTTPPPSAGT